MRTTGPSVLQIHAAWVLVATYALSIVYELWRATSKAGTSRHDSMRVFFTQDLPLYVIASVVIALLFAGWGAAPWIGLGFCAVFIVVSIVYYNPRILPERQPGLVDWAEDLVYTGLLFVAATLLLYEVLGWSLVST